MFMKLLAKNWQYIIIAILIATNVLVYNYWLSTRDELILCNERYSSKVAEVEASNKYIGVQNVSIDNWKVESEKLNTKIKSLTSKFIDIDNKYNKSLYDLMNTKVPESCDGSMNWLLKYGIEK